MSAYARSQEMEFLVEGLDPLALLLDGSLLRSLLDGSGSLLLTLLATARANVHVELGDLVRVLARSWHLDGTGPVEVEVAQGERKLLQLDLLHGGLVKRHMEMGGKDAALVSTGGRHEEIELLSVTVLIVVRGTGSLDEGAIDDATGGRVLQVALSVLDEEALRDALVHHDEGDARLLTVTVNLREHLLELGDLRGDNLVSHGITNTVSVDDEVGGQVRLVSLLEGLDGSLEGVAHLTTHNFLTLRLHDELGEVLGQLGVDRSGESHNGGRTRMADIDTNEHGLDSFEHSGELHGEEIAADLRVDLSEDVRGLGHVEFGSVAHSDHLRWHLVLLEQLLVHLVVVFVGEDHQDDQGVTEHRLGALHHEVEQTALHLVSVSLVFYLKEVGLFNADLKLTASVDEVVVDGVGDVVVGASLASLRVLVDHDPLLGLQVN